MMKRMFGIFGLCLIAGTLFGVTVTRDRVGRFKFRSAPTSVSWTIPSESGTQSGVGVFYISVEFGDAAVAANTFTLKKINGVSKLTNTVLSATFTNSYIYAPEPMFFDAGDTLVYENTQTGAELTSAYYSY